LLLDKVSKDRKQKR